MDLPDTPASLFPINRRAIPAEAVESLWHASDRWPIRRIDWRPFPGVERRGALLFLVGRGDHYEKYLETLDGFAREGWAVTSIDWRGQGGSGRLLSNPRIGHIDDFSTWIGDLEHFWRFWRAENAGPHVVVAHSMGGHLTMRALSENVIDPDAVALSAPMLGVRTGGIPLAVNHAVAKAFCAIGLSERPAWKESEKPLSSLSLREKILTHDDDRYLDEIAWWQIRPDVKLGPPSWRWVERAIASIRLMEEQGRIENIRTPVLLMATHADQLVDTNRIIADEKKLPNGEILLLGKEAAHELLREADPVRDACLNRIRDFFDRHARRP